ncbi:Presqualene diphosphate phosphatase isoform 3 [Schistosoma japonicum]|uniref:Presqualene diphosphate phosphatase isoform 3 n=1 Tax=Schistosoma japonicum TaxID=6182 RepID=A0A4Z2DCC9_SCHJA|nr:Phospholipid phosphatase 6 [Schistosoma japonicum]KAH8869400.1 Phospholipid phosphatase 6 [Schistosoma japonicum]TNN14157.1 Presqualene diphosphate phosphatase isoform 3 [Schistosoma japonicum]
MATSTWTRNLNLFLEWTGHGVLWIGFVSIWLITLLVENSHAFTSYSSLEKIWKWTDQMASEETDIVIDKNIARLFCLLIALLFDAIMVGMIKFLFRRQRPKENNHSDMLFTVSIDAWSFPSGHASRSTMLFFLIKYLWLSTSTLWLISSLLLLLWNLTVCYSRYAMHRHHFIDILAGYILGFIEYWLIIQIS